MLSATGESETFPAWIVQDIPELATMFLNAGNYKLSQTTNADRVNIAHLRASAEAMELIAQQPELSDDIKATLNPFNIATAETRASYLFHLSSLYSASSIQPEIIETILIPLTPTIYSSSVKLKTLFEQVARLASYKALFKAMARQPEMASDLADAAIKYARAGQDVAYENSPFVILSRSYAVGAILDAIAQQPELSDTLNEYAKIFLGEKKLITDANVKFASDQYIRKKLTAAMVRQPEAEPLFDNALSMLIDYN